MSKAYISFDIEASGRTPGRYSMLSLGACLVDDTSVRFYKELKPISSEYIEGAMRVGSMGLKCLEPYKEDPTCNPLHADFVPERVLEILSIEWESPKDAMESYALWLQNVTWWEKPVEAAAPLRFDSMWTTWYFDNFYDKENPFGYTGGEDINSLYRGIVRNTQAHVKDLCLRHGELTHNALEDAVQQAKEFQQVLALIK